MKHRESARRRLGFFFADITSLSHSLCVEIQEAQKEQLNSSPHPPIHCKTGGVHIVQDTRT